MKDHVLLSKATEIEVVDKAFAPLLTEEVIRSIVELLPDEWLEGEFFETIQEHREAYIEFLLTRIAHSMNFVNEVQNARKKFI